MDDLEPVRKTIADILYKQASKKELTSGELRLLAEWESASDENHRVVQMLRDDDELTRSIKDLYSVDKESIWEELQQRRSINARNRRISVIKMNWFRFAAAIFIAVGFGTVVYFLTTDATSKHLPTVENKPIQIDIPAGGNKAMLTLGDGSVIVLDSARNGTIARQGNAAIIKLSTGEIRYQHEGPSSGGPVSINTISTPKGGQYQLTLPDGTKVWLNAASSITYPTAFLNKTRSVKISGEVYFEVAKNKKLPFIVDANGRSSVEVLGTAMNINSYPDEGSIKTTLLEGRVKVMAVGASSDGQSTANAGSVVAGSTGLQHHAAANDERIFSSFAILKPGQQATIAFDGSSDGPLERGAGIVVKSVDVDQALAWKNGLFNFDESDLYTVMRQLERWYDIKVEYQGSVSNIIFQGKMYRNANLSDVLEMLQKMDVRFRVEGKKLIVF